MPTVEIDEEEIRRLKALESTVGTIMKHPKAALLIEQAHKLVDEKAPTPRLDASKPVDERFDAQEKRIADLQKKIDDDQADREKTGKLSALNAKIEDGIAKLRRQGVTEEGIEGVRKIMEDEGILNPQIAWDHFEKLHPPAVPVSQKGSGPWNFMELPAQGDEDIKQLIQSKGESEPLLRKQIADALTDVRGAPRH